jgi:hypothetical protein
MSSDHMQQVTLNEVILSAALERIEQKLDLLDRKIEQVRLQQIIIETELLRQGQEKEEPF